MDEVDVAVLRWLMTGLAKYPARSEIRESLSSASRKLNLTETTMRSRINSLFGSGFLRGWGVFVNPRAVGQHVAFTRYDVLPPSAKNDVIRKFRLIDGAWNILNNQGNTVEVGLYYEDEEQLKRKVELMTRIANSEQVIYGEVPFPPCSYHFEKEDLAVIEAVQESPDISYTAIAKRVLLSSRTVRRRLSKMIHEKALFVTMDFDLSKSKGILIADLIVEHADENAGGNTEERILARFGPRIFAASRGNPKLSFFTFVLDNIADVENLLAEVKHWDGVKDAHIDLAREYIALFHRFREQVKKLEKKKEEMTSAPSATPTGLLR